MHPKAQGRAAHPGSRSRNDNLPRRGFINAGATVIEPRWGSVCNRVIFPGCAAARRPWALGSNALGVGKNTFGVMSRELSVILSSLRPPRPRSSSCHCRRCSPPSRRS
jgi:hypothetical protein